MAFNKWLNEQLIKYNRSGKQSDFPIDYQELLCVIEAATYPSYNFLIQLIEFFSLESFQINEMVQAVSEDLGKTSDEIYSQLLCELENIKEDAISLIRNME